MAFATPLLRRSIGVVFRFHDAFYFPIDDLSPPVRTPLEVSIPSLEWSALRSEVDATYRFSALTLTHAAPTGANLAVQVISSDNSYMTLEQIRVTLPLPVSSPPRRSDFMISLPLWPTTGFRLPLGETALRGHIRSASAQPVSELKVQAWVGGAAIPPPGTPYTRSDAHGDFLIRFPLLKGPPGGAEPINVQLSDGTVPVTPASLSITRGQMQTLEFQRT